MNDGHLTVTTAPAVNTTFETAAEDRGDNQHLHAPTTRDKNLTFDRRRQSRTSLIAAAAPVVTNRTFDGSSPKSAENGGGLNNRTYDGDNNSSEHDIDGVGGGNRTFDHPPPPQSNAPHLQQRGMAMSSSNRTFDANSPAANGQNFNRGVSIHI